MEEVKLCVPDISCDHCVRAISRSVSQLAGIGAVDGDTRGKTVTVSFDPAQTSLAAIEQKIEEAGYRVAK